MAQELSVVRVMHRVDTAHPQVRQVLRLWLDSLQHWREGKRSDIQGGFFSSTGAIVRDWFAQDDEVVTYFPATVMSVEFDGGGWVVRTMFARLDAISKSAQPLGILRSRFVSREDATGLQGWMLDDALSRSMASWDTTRVGFVTYVHPKELPVDTARANEVMPFCRTIASRFGQPEPAAITILLSGSRDELCQILGVEYYAFPPKAISFPQASLIIESEAEVFHPHELVHLVFRDFDRAHPILREGLATLLGGSGLLDYYGALDEYLKQRSHGRIPSFVELFTADDLDQSDEYILGAVICDRVLRIHGMAALLEMLRLERPSDAMLSLSRMLGLDIADLQESLRSMAVSSLNRGDAGR
ncbi:MAG: hypothetical protein NTX15_09210 [Candidatus Kapabacteria bacterium]|nr:hypothetical protein [Candidatus Kapabacteria bacterium]